jgi:hypothetical protein
VVLGDLWCSGKHRHHGGKIQVLTTPDGWPIGTSPVRPGREHYTTALRAHPEALPLLAEWSDEGHAVLGDLGYEGEADLLRIPIKRTDDQCTLNRLHAVTRALAERGDALLKITFTVLRRVGPCPWRIGAITAAGRRPVGIGREPRRCPFHPAPRRGPASVTLSRGTGDAE